MPTPKNPRRSELAPRSGAAPRLWLPSSSSSMHSSQRTPTLVAEYQTKLPDNAVLEAKLDELFAMLDREASGGDS